MRLGRSVVNLVLGRRLANQEHAERKITAFEGVPAMGLDGIGSSAYGPEAALTVLIPLGAAGLIQIGVVMLPTLLAGSLIAACAGPSMTAAAGLDFSEKLFVR